MIAIFLLNRMSMKRRRNLGNKPVVAKNTEKDVQFHCCRTCLCTEDLVSIFYSKETEQRRSDDLRLVTGLEIKMNDGLSQMMCSKCLEIMNTALQFRRTCKKSEKSLLSMTVKKTKSKHGKITKPKKSILEKVDEDFGYDDYTDDYGVFQDFKIDISQSEPDITQAPVAKPVAAKRKLRTTNTTPYRCNICEKDFKMKATYKAHMRFHTNYCVCESCGKRCRNNNQLQEHKRARHGLGRIHKCAYCEYSSATKEALTIHERRHTGERPYICDHCGAAFHRRSNLVQHIAIHLPEKNFQCDLCPKKLKSRKFLQIHKHNAHTGKRYGYLCPICEHRFEKPNKVRAHTRRVHGLPDDQQGAIPRVQL